MKNILIIGGSYFIGRIFVEELRSHDDYTVYVLNRGNNPLHLKYVNEIYCDRHDTAALGKAIPHLNWHTVIDFCAYEPKDVVNILDYLPGEIEHYIFISTATVYEPSCHLPIKENAPKLEAPIPGPYGDYGYKKWLTEIELTKKCKENKIPYTILRPVFVYGKYNYAPRESYFFKLIAAGRPFIVPTLPQSLFSMVSVWDISKVILKCLQNESVINSVYNISGPELITYDEIVEHLPVAWELGAGSLAM